MTTQFADVITNSGDKVHVSIRGTRVTLCGHPTAGSAGRAADCKRCITTETKIRNAETTAAPAPVEPTAPAETPAETPAVLSRPLHTQGENIPAGAEHVYSFSADWIIGLPHGRFDLYRMDEDAAYGELGDGVKWYGVSSFNGTPPVPFYMGGSLVDALQGLSTAHAEHARHVDQSSISLAGVRVATIVHGVVVINFLPDAETAAETAAPAPFSLLSLSDSEREVMETNRGRLGEVIRAAQEVQNLGGEDVRAHRLTYFRPGTLALRQDVDPAAYSSAVINANDTAREEGWPRLSERWFACLDSTYVIHFDENKGRAADAAYRAEQDAEMAAEAAAEAASVAECQEAIGGDPWRADNLGADAELTAALDRLETALLGTTEAADGPLVLSLTPTGDGRLMARLGAFEKPFRDDSAAKLHASYWARTKGARGTGRGSRFTFRHCGEGVVSAPAVFA